MSAYQHLGLSVAAVVAGILLGAVLATIIRRRAERQAESSAASCLTIPDDDRFRLVAVGALKPPPLVLRIDWLHEGDAHRLAALGTGIAGRGGLARCRWFGVGQCGLSSQPRFEECGNRREMPSTKGGARIDVLRCKFAALPQIEVSDGCKLATLADYRTKSWVPS